jgi:hypothetical protein
VEGGGWKLQVAAHSRTCTRWFQMSETTMCPSLSMATPPPGKLNSPLSRAQLQSVCSIRVTCCLHQRLLGPCFQQRRDRCRGRKRPNAMLQVTGRAEVDSRFEVKHREPRKKRVDQNKTTSDMAVATTKIAFDSKRFPELQLYNPEDGEPQS